MFDGLIPDRIMFSGNSLFDKKLNLLYDSNLGHYSVITNLKGAMTKKYICNGCDTLYKNTHKCDEVCSLCTATQPCTKDQTGYCVTYNRQFLSEKCFQNHLTFKVKDKLVCQWRQVCRNFSYLVTSDSKYEYFKIFYNYCNKKQPSGHFCYVATLNSNKLSDMFLYVFFDTEFTQHIEKGDASLSVYRTPYVLNKCVVNVKPWTI